MLGTRTARFALVGLRLAVALVLGVQAAATCGAVLRAAAAHTHPRVALFAIAAIEFACCILVFAAPRRLLGLALVFASLAFASSAPRRSGRISAPFVPCLRGEPRGPRRRPARRNGERGEQCLIAA